MSKPQSNLPLAGGIQTVSAIIGRSASTVRRRMKSDDDFPKPWRDGPRGRWQWLLEEIEAYLRNKARQQAIQK